MSKVICWWSGGITSAVACKIAINLYGKNNCKVIFIDTFNEDDDTYRFKDDCANWYGVEIETITAIGDKYNSIEDVWRKYKSLNTASGAICSSTLKSDVRKKWQKENNYKHQVFGFEFDTKEFKRAKAMKLNYPETKPIFPLIMMAMNKQDCIDYVNKENIKPPRVYSLGLMNNNCAKTGCIQGGISYWQHLKNIMPDQFEKMAALEHELTDAKGKPVTILKDQSKESIKLANSLGLNRKYMPLFLKKHKDYPEIQTVMDKNGRKQEPLKDCNGFCGINDLVKDNKNVELNYDG